MCVKEGKQTLSHTIRTKSFVKQMVLFVEKYEQPMTQQHSGDLPVGVLRKDGNLKCKDFFWESFWWMGLAVWKANGGLLLKFNLGSSEAGTVFHPSHFLCAVPLP